MKKIFVLLLILLLMPVSAQAFGNPAARIKSLKETPNIEIDPLNQEEVKALLNKTKEVTK